MSEPLAHSARNGARAQTYHEHIGNARRYAAIFAHDAVAFSPKWGESFLAVVESATTYHDLGKLDEVFQDVLRHNRQTNRGFKHWDAGSAYLLEQKAGEAAAIVFAHHLGLPNYKHQINNDKFRDYSEIQGLRLKQNERTDDLLASYLTQHHALLPTVTVKPCKLDTGLVRRLALSCLVDADHSDTAQHYRNERELRGQPLWADKRLKRLNHYVTGLAPAELLPTEQERLRLSIRQKIYEECRDRKLASHERIVACDSPVGTGKTTAVMAHLLNIAHEHSLRRIFVVLPYTNIIDQSVDVYRRALVLDGESPDEVVAAHHHRVEFKGENWRDLRQLTQRWDAPVVVTTAVQFFETLAAKETTALRKLHQVSGSAIFVDEAHTAMPAPLWPQMWKWLRELCDDWGCHVVLASGSLARFWDVPDFVPPAERPPVMELIPSKLRREAAAVETRRVELKTKPERLSLDELADFVQSKPGPRLVILNTIQSAAILADHLRYGKNLGLNVEHLSTALSPLDRSKAIRRVKENLSSGWKDWVLVATSCVEAGMDFSFRTAFRESCGLANLLQISGRVSRSAEYDTAEVWDFRHDEDGFLTLHPHFKTSRRVLEKMFREGKVGMDHCTEALQREINSGVGETEKLAERICQHEKDADYPEVAKLCRLIVEDAQTILVNQDLVMRFESRNREQFPSGKEVMLNSVQVKQSRLIDLDPKPVGFGCELLALRPEQYDDFLGYMKGILPLLKAQKSGCFIR
ncbi:MAG: CRISPR-associated endonuclease Cas3'' [Elusimicrobia bacterium]|nr:CRISPR-associated endonuclease Cas3'' [Elusimicrobiota bacterium]